MLKCIKFGSDSYRQKQLKQNSAKRETRTAQMTLCNSRVYTSRCENKKDNKKQMWNARRNKVDKTKSKIRTHT